MPLRQLAKAQWRTYFERVSGALDASRVEIEVTGLGLGGEARAEWIPLLGLSYEPESDLLSVIAEGARHLIRHPKQVYVEHEEDWLLGIEVLDAEGVRHFMLLRDPLMLPAP